MSRARADSTLSPALRHIRQWVGAALLATSGCTTLAGKSPLVSDRPDFTESASVVAPRDVQLEAGITKASEAHTHALAVGEALLRIGLVEHVELRVGLNSYSTVHAPGAATVRGLDDAALGLKLGLIDAPDSRAWIPQLAVIVGTSLPTGAARLRAPGAQPEVKLLAACELTDRLAFSSNVNYARTYSGASTVGEYAASASFPYAVNDRVGAFAEGFAFLPRDGSGASQKFFNVGPTLLLSPDLQLGARAGIGPSSARRDYFVGVGLVKRW